MKLSFPEPLLQLSEPIQSAAQSRRAQLSTTNIVLAEVFTADNWENRQVDAFSDYVRLRELDRRRRTTSIHVYILYTEEKQTSSWQAKNLILTKIPSWYVGIYTLGLGCNRIYDYEDLLNISSCRREGLRSLAGPSFSGWTNSARAREKVYFLPLYSF